ncbi:MAG TPA: hypothetical protein PKG95_06880 [Anaerolineaceae bacterium]|jgi:hypothetical protein|nr:hypothetical protein [Anaerolineaceae bacterium]
MNRWPRIFTLALLLLCVLALPIASDVTAAQQIYEEFFEETGYWVRGPMLTQYYSSPAPNFFYGFPITRQYTDPQSGSQVQFFQRARFEMRQTAAGPVVTVSPLGEWLHDRTADLAEFPRSAASCRIIGAYPVCYAFLQFYDSNQGSETLGIPVSDAEIRDGRMVQYFEYARLEWQPDNPAGLHVVLTDVGRIYFDLWVKNNEVTQPESTGNIPISNLRPQVFAFSQHALIQANTVQKIYVIVQDQFLQPLPNALVTVTIYIPGQPAQTLPVINTNRSGFAVVDYAVGDLPENELIQVRVMVLVGGKQIETQTWFRIWW